MELSDLVYIDSTGFHFADYPTFLQFFTDGYQGIYGADTNLAADTQDGQFIAIQAKAAYDTASIAASTYNSFSPVTAQGVGLSRNVKINGINRRVPTNSVVDLTIVGQSGTVLTDAIATDALNQKWLIPVTTIPGGGSVTATAVAELPGAITADANTINQIFTPTRGWQTVNNVLAATPGEPVETDAELRLRQQQSTANPSLTVLDGTNGAVLNVSGVLKERGYENDTGTTDGNGLPAHSISILVKGGDDVEIANAIALHKTPGTRTFATGAGAVSEIVYDAHGMPLTINFQRPTSVTIKAEITIAVDIGWTSEYEALIQQAVADFINENRIGDTVIISKLFTPAYLTGTPAGQTFDITTLEIGKNMDPVGDVNIVLDYDEEAICVADTDVTVIVT